MIDHDHGQVNLLLVALGRSCKLERSVADGRDINFVANCATVAATLDQRSRQSKQSVQMPGLVQIEAIYTVHSPSNI